MRFRLTLANKNGFLAAIRPIITAVGLVSVCAGCGHSGGGTTVNNPTQQDKTGIHGTWMGLEMNTSGASDPKTVSVEFKADGTYKVTTDGANSTTADSGNYAYDEKTKTLTETKPGANISGSKGSASGDSASLNQTVQVDWTGPDEIVYMSGTKRFDLRRS